MAPQTPLPIAPPPGVVVTESQLASVGRWVAPMDKIRFKNKKPQKIGGWVRAVTTPTSGTPRAIHAWRDNNFNNYLAAGTYRKLYVYDTAWAQNDITPYRLTGTLGNNPFATVSGSTVVTVTHTAHGLNVGDTAIYSGASTFNNVTMNGTFIVQTVIGANSYTVNAVTTASGTGSGGGASVAFSYEIPIGTELGAYGYGYGVGGYGLGTYGTARSSSTLFIEPRVWSLDHFGQFLVASYNGGSVYLFDETQAQPWPRAVLISNDSALPGVGTNPTARFSFVTQERFVFVLCSGMNVQWCSQGDYTTWTPATNNTANTRTLNVGTKLVAGCVLGPELAAVWSDAALYIFQYTGSSFVYNSRVAGVDCGLIAPGAFVSVQGMAFWMGPNNFWMWNGSVVPMPNVEDIRKYVFDSLNTSTTYQCNATYNPIMNEVVFHYTTGSNTNPDSYVTFHLDPTDLCWSIGKNTRTSGTHFTQGDTRPYFGDGSDFYIYQHENTNDNNGAALPWTLTLAPYALSTGLMNMQVGGVNWDFQNQVGTISCTINAYDRINDTAAVIMDTETDSFPPSGGGFTDVRVCGRYIGISFTDNELGSYMRFGAPTAYVRPRGIRP
jgi:hypothetical protein